ncbi:MAG: hypothetical protein K0S49_11 [Microbacterium sp.]|nr:hypothetical protein [Microbacterium sp.]
MIILAQPAAPAPEAIAQFDGIKHEWIGWDGSVWTLSDWQVGVCFTAGGIIGMHNPRGVKYTSRARGVPGHRLRGWQADPRRVGWQVFVWHDESSDEWLALNDAFFTSIHPELEGTWRVTAGGRSRELRLTGAFDDDHGFPEDPVYEGWATYEFNLDAAQPFWTGEPITRSWADGAGVPFIPAEGGPSFFVSTGRTFASAAIANPGDVAAYPVWTIRGPLTDVAIGIDGVLIELGAALIEGDVLVIDTDPRNLTATLNGVDYAQDLGFQRYAPVPAKGQTSLDVAATGAGSVAVSLTPLYFRAF